MSLFTLTELASYLQQDLDTATATLLRDLAEADVRAAVKQTLTYVHDDVATIPVNPLSARLTLPQRPVIDVTSVKVDGTEASWRWDGLDVIVAQDSWQAWVTPYPTPAPPVPNPLGVVVTYSHGSDDVAYLSVARGVALAVAARKYDNPLAYSQEAIDDYSRTTTAVGSSLTDEEVKRLRRAYGRRTFSVVTS